MDGVLLVERELRADYTRAKNATGYQTTEIQFKMQFYNVCLFLSAPWPFSSAPSGIRGGMGCRKILRENDNTWRGAKSIPY